MLWRRSFTGTTLKVVLPSESEGLSDILTQVLKLSGDNCMVPEQEFEAVFVVILPASISLLNITETAVFTLMRNEFSSGETE